MSRAALAEVAGRVTGLRALIAEDDPHAADLLRGLLADKHFEVVVCADGEAAARHLERHGCDLLMTDLRLPRLDGLELIRRAHRAAPSMVIVVTTAYASIESTVDALRSGAADYLPKPFTPEHFADVLRRAMPSMGASPLRQGAEGPEPTAPGELVVGRSKAMRQAVTLADRVAGSDAQVLIRGETGTGKELLARRIHAASPRRGRAFVRLNCANLTPSLAESQLFGSEKGSYTSSFRNTIGVLESAEGGTVFLDEIGELPLDVQVRLLDFLQDRTFRRLGDARVRRADVRVLMATHRDLDEMLRLGAFRADLYYRVRQVQVWLPPLRDRREDLADLTRHLLARVQPPRERTLSAEAVDLVASYPWPGNVRELEQTLTAAAAFSEGGVLDAADLRVSLGLEHVEADPRPGVEEAWAPPSPDAPLEEVARWHIRRAVAACRGNVSAAARALGIDRSTVYRKSSERPRDP